MLSFGYVVSTFLPLTLDINTTPTNIGFRFVYFSLSVFLIFYGIRKTVKTGMPASFWLISVFLFLYSIRILYDVFFLDIIFKDSLFYLLSYSFAGSFIPFFAMALYAKSIDYDILLKSTFYLLLLSGVLLLVLIYNIYHSFSPELFLYRVSLTRQNGEEMSVNPITLSYFGSALSLLSFYNIFYKRNLPGIFNILGIIVGIVLLILGASRGPQVSFTFCFLFLLFKYIFSTKKGLSTKITFFLTSICVLASIIYLISLVDLTKVTMYNRFANFGDGLRSDTNTRENSWAGAWQQFLDSPLWGDSYLGKIDLYYPHNIYLEILMALGFIGAALFFTPYVIFLFKKIDNDNKIGVYLIFLSISISSTFSGGLFINPLLWSTLGIMCYFDQIKGRSLAIK